MRSHGVTNFADPTGNGRSFSVSGLDTNSDTFKSANQACQKYIRAITNITPSQQAQNTSEQLKFANCMRTHGIPDYPDPATQKSTSGGASDTLPRDLQPGSPGLEAAMKACQQYLPGAAG